MNRFLAIAALLFSLGSAANAGEYMIHAGRMIDVVSGRVVEKASITISGTRIVKVESGYKAATAGQEIIDLRDQTIMPGLMDMHVHLTTEQTPTYPNEKFRLESADYAFRAKTFAERTLLAGFTTVRELGDQDRNLGAAMRRAIDKGYFHGPRIFTAGKGLATTGGVADYTSGLRSEFMGDPGPIEGVINGPILARQAVRQRYKDGADLIKINVDGASVNRVGEDLGPQWMQDELDAVVATAADYRMTVTAHAHTRDGIERAVRAGVNSIEHGTLMDEATAQEMKKRGTALVPTMTALKGSGLVRIKSEDEHDQGGGDRIDRTVRMAHRIGVRIVFGSDAGVFPNGTNAQEFVFMVGAGLTPMEAIQSATIEAAKLLRYEKSIGSIEAGKLADLVAVPGDPLTDISRMKSISFVMKDGILYKQGGKVVLPIGDQQPAPTP